MREVRFEMVILTTNLAKITAGYRAYLRLLGETRRVMERNRANTAHPGENNQEEYMIFHSMRAFLHHMIVQ